jgi:hypothetical protein
MKQNSALFFPPLKNERNLELTLNIDEQEIAIRALPDGDSPRLRFFFLL